MDTDTVLYRLFRDHPDWLRDLTGLPIPTDSVATSQALKQLEIRCDLLLEPIDHNDPCWVIEFQFYHDHSIFNRAELARQLLWKHLNNRNDCRMRDYQPRRVKSVIIFGSQTELPNHTPEDYPLTEVLFFDELLETLEQNQPDSPLLAALAPLSQPLNLLENEASAHYHSIRNAQELPSADRDILTEIFLNLLLQRFKTKTHEEIRTMIAELTPIKETRVGQELLEEGIERGIERGMERGIKRGMEKVIRAMAFKGKSASEISELTDVPIQQIERFLAEGGESGA